MRHIAIAGAALLVALLSGCSADDGPNGPTNAPGPNAPGDSSVPDGDACYGLTTEALASAFGVQLDGPEEGRDDTDDDGVLRTVSECDWDSNDLDVDFSYSVAADFADGTVVCPEPRGTDVTAVEDLGTQAWWTVDDDADGELRACSDDVVLELDLDAEDDTTTSDALRAGAVEVLRDLL